VDTAHQRSLKHAPGPVAPLQLAPPKRRRPAASKLVLNRRERLISTAYLAMIVIGLAFLTVTGLVAWLGT
jgi:hypothetical protein